MSAGVAIERRDGFAGTEVGSTRMNMLSGFSKLTDLAVETRSPSREFAKDAEQVLQELFFDPKASREYARDAYLVQAGNIYVNQVRLTSLTIALEDPDFLTKEQNS